MYTYICLKCTQFLKINAGNSLRACTHDRWYVPCMTAGMYHLWPLVCIMNDRWYVPCMAAGMYHAYLLVCAMHRCCMACRFFSLLSSNIIYNE